MATLSPKEIEELKLEILKRQPNLNLANYSQDELVELGTLLQGQQPSIAKEPITTFEKYPKSMTALSTTLDWATLNNLAEIKAYEDSLSGKGDYASLRDKYEKELLAMQQEEPGAALAGKIAGFLTGAAALPATLPIKGLTAIQKTAAAGGLTGALQDTTAKEGEMWYQSPEGAIEKGLSTLGGVLGGYAGAKWITPGMLKLAKWNYSRPFEKIDAVLREQGKPALSDLLWKYKISGNMEEVRDGLKNVLEENQYKTINAAWDAVEASGQKFDPDALYSLFTAPLKTETIGKEVGAIQDVANKESYEAVKDFFDTTLKEFRPAGYAENLQKYKADFRKYLEQKKAFEAQGGVGQQPALPYAMTPQKTVGKEITPELYGAPENVLASKEYTPEQLNIDIKNLITSFGIRPQAQKIIKTIKEPFFVPESPDIFKATQREIIGREPVQRSFGEAVINAVEAPKGQFNIPLVEPPIAPQRPSKDMNIYELSKFLAGLGKSAEKGFLPKGSQVRVQPEASIMAPLYGIGKGIREAAVEKATDKATREAFEQANKEVSTAYAAFPTLSKYIVREAGVDAITPLELAFLSNPYTAGMSLVKETAEAAKTPKVATNIGLFLRNAIEDALSKKGGLTERAVKKAVKGATTTVPMEISADILSSIPYYLKPNVEE